MRNPSFGWWAMALGAVFLLSACGEKEGRCESSADCGAEEICDTDRGECAPAGCQWTTDCEPGQFCNTTTGQCEGEVDICLARPTPCLGLSACDPATGECVGVECNTAMDCAINQICNTANECEEYVDQCLARPTPCPGVMTCDPPTGDCVGTCCTGATCPDPRTECDEGLCASGVTACVQKTCTDDPGQPEGCPVAFDCNRLTDPPSCVAACIAGGCPEVGQSCDAATGACVRRLPLPGEVGTPCLVNSDCDVSSGLGCFDEATYGIRGGLCTKPCNTGTECPTGSFCDGVCVDGCEVGLGDCLHDQQCISSRGAPADYCFPIFDESECTTGCLPDGAPCDESQSDRCQLGAACVDLAGGDTLCVPLSCHLGIDRFDPAGPMVTACEAGQTCQELGIGLSGCVVDCDPTDPSACASLSNAQGTVACGPTEQIESGEDAYFLADSAGDCAGTAMPDSTSVSVGGANVFICYDACLQDLDCDPGQFCGATEVRLVSGETGNFETCLNYNLREGVTCADVSAPCGARDCQDIATGGATTLVACFDACGTDADCPEGACRRLEFASGDTIDLCLHETAGAYCSFGCTTHADCGYCITDADCPSVSASQGIVRQQRCDLSTSVCVTPLNGVAEANAFCESGQLYWSEAIKSVNASGNPISVGGCAIPCDSDTECGGGLACVPEAASPASGFCAWTTLLCNGSAGQCEPNCGVGTDCLQGVCQVGDGPQGENRCVAP